VDEQAALKLVSARVVPIIQWAAAKLATARDTTIATQ
jgi:hypothetical protein